MKAALDSSVLILLAKAETLDVLPELFRTLVIAPAVRKEAIDDAPNTVERRALENELKRLGIRDAELDPKSLAGLSKRFPFLGRGELETLALAAAKVADIVVMDDRVARHAARLEGIKVVGTLGVLAAAFRNGTLPRADLVRSMERLTQAGLWIAPPALESFWAGVGGR